MVVNTEKILGVPVADVGLTQVVDGILAAISRPRNTLTIVCANAHTLAVAARDAAVRRAFLEAELVLPDGLGTALASWIVGGRLRRKVGGPDVLERLTERANRGGGLRYFFLGTTPETLARIRQRLERDYPNIVVTGVHAPPMGPISTAETERIIDKINRSRSDVLWVGMSAPKQETWLLAHAQRLNVPVALAVGAAFDFFCGNKRRPRWAVRSGLFWLYRLLTEPRRLGRRYLVDLPRFILLAARHAVGNGRSESSLAQEAPSGSGFDLSPWAAAGLVDLPKRTRADSLASREESPPPAPEIRSAHLIDPSTASHLAATKPGKSTRA